MMLFHNEKELLGKLLELIKTNKVVEEAFLKLGAASSSLFPFAPEIARGILSGRLIEAGVSQCQSGAMAKAGEDYAAAGHILVRLGKPVAYEILFAEAIAPKVPRSR